MSQNDRQNQNSTPHRHLQRLDCESGDLRAGSKRQVAGREPKKKGTSRQCARCTCQESSKEQALAAQERLHKLTFLDPPRFFPSLFPIAPRPQRTVAKTFFFGSRGEGARGRVLSLCVVCGPLLLPGGNGPWVREMQTEESPAPSCSFLLLPTPFCSFLLHSAPFCSILLLHAGEQGKHEARKKRAAGCKACNLLLWPVKDSGAIIATCPDALSTVDRAVCSRPRSVVSKTVRSTVTPDLQWTLRSAKRGYACLDSATMIC